MHENQEHKQKCHAPFLGVEFLPDTARIHVFCYFDKGFYEIMGLRLKALF